VLAGVTNPLVALMENIQSNTLSVSIPHNLGKDEALRRLQSGLAQAEAQFSALFTVQEQMWTDNTLQFQVRALGQAIRGTIEVGDTQVRLDVVLPWLLARIASAIRQVVQKQGTRLLEKK
jgi:hypothetical protein